MPSAFFLADFKGDFGLLALLFAPPPPLLQPTLVEAVGVDGICCSSLLGVFVDDVGVGKAELRETAVVFTLPIIGEQESTKGEFSF